jgi:hypothetical protein
LFLTCSLQVPKGSHQVFNMFPRFPMCSPKVFPIAPCFNPICFAQSPPLFTYIGGPKGEDFFHFSFVPNMFIASSQWVPIKFSICSFGSQCVPQGCSQ